MSKFIKKMLILTECICFFSSVALSNPLETTPFSEVQIIDQSHWTIEVACQNLRIMPLNGLPNTTDSITLFCDSSSTRPPVDSLKICTGKVTVDTFNICLITEKNFPTIKLRTGWSIYIGYKGSPYCYGPLTIMSGLTSTSSIVSGYSEPTCCSIINGECMMYCRSLIYKISTSPSIGKINSVVVGTKTIYKKNVPPNLRILSSLAHNIIISVSQDIANEHGEIQIYSLNGLLVRKIPFEVYGAGTYTINWNGYNERNQMVSAGSYSCRVQIGNESSCKGFINW